MSAELEALKMQGQALITKREGMIAENSFLESIGYRLKFASAGFDLLAAEQSKIADKMMAIEKRGLTTIKFEAGK